VLANVVRTSVIILRDANGRRIVTGI
jgi:hypothetical protein